MQGDLLSMRKRTIERAKRTRRKQSKRVVKPVDFGLLLSWKIPQPLVVQPIPVPQQSENSGRKLLELVWEQIDSRSLKAFQLGDKLSKSSSHTARTAGSLLALTAIYYGLHKLDEKLAY